MLLKPERAQLRNLISEAVLLLCKNSCTEFQNLSIEGIIGITFDEEDVVLVSFKDEASISNVSKSQAIQKLPTTAPSEKVAPQLLQEVTVAPASCEQIDSIANSQPSVRPGASKRKRLRSFEDENEKSSPTNNVAGNDSLPDSSIHSSSRYETTANSDILTDDKSEIKISRICTLADVDAAVKNSGIEISSEQKLQQTPEKVDPKTPQNSTGSSRLISVKNDTVSFGELGSDVSIKCEENSEDGDCVFIKSEIFELGDNNVFDFAPDAVMSNSRMVNEESLFGDSLLQYPGSGDFGVEGQGHRSRQRAKSQYPEYIQRGCDVQAASSSGQTVEDRTVLPFGSFRSDGLMECHICGAVLKCRRNLEDHIEGTHYSRCRYMCLYCGRGFKWRCKLSCHKKICEAAAQSGWIPKMN